MKLICGTLLAASNKHETISGGAKARMNINEMVNAKGVSLRSRVMLIVLGILLTGAALLFFKIQDDQRQSLREAYASAIESAVSNRGVHLQVYINELSKQTRFLVQTPPVRAIARTVRNGGVDPVEGDSQAVWRARLEEIFKSFLLANPHYFQLRYIGLADNGMELNETHASMGADGGASFSRMVAWVPPTSDPDPPIVG